MNLIEAYLRMNGYFTLSEFEVQRKTQNGDYQTVTDVDVVAIRFPGDIYAADSHRPAEAELLVIEDPVLGLEPDVVDVIIAEVKQGPAVLNPGLTDHHTLHSVLGRIDWLYQQGIHEVVEKLQAHHVCYGPARGGGRVRTRLVAFGRSEIDDVNTVSLGHVFEVMVGYFQDFDDVLRPAQVKEPAPALIRLLVKIGFKVARD